MKPLAIQVGKRIVLLAGSPKDLKDIAVVRNPNANLVLVKVELDS